MSDPQRRPDLEIDLPDNGSLVIDAGHDPGFVVLDATTHVDLEEAEPGNGMISLHTAEMVKIRDYLDAVIAFDVQSARDCLADPEAAEDARKAARRIIAAVPLSRADHVLAIVHEMEDTASGLWDFAQKLREAVS